MAIILRWSSPRSPWSPSAVERSFVSQLGNRFRDHRSAGVFAAADPHQALVLRSPGEPDHPALPAHDPLAALLRRGRIFLDRKRTPNNGSGLGSHSRSRADRLLRRELPRLHRPAVRRGGGLQGGVSFPSPPPARAVFSFLLLRRPPPRRPPPPLLLHCAGAALV